MAGGRGNATGAACTVGGGGAVVGVVGGGGAVGWAGGIVTGESGPRLDSRAPGADSGGCGAALSKERYSVATTGGETAGARSTGRDGAIGLLCGRSLAVWSGAR